MVTTMNLMQTIDQLIQSESWHPIGPVRKRKKPEKMHEYLERILRLTAARASMASWGLPFEAIAASLLTAQDRRSLTQASGELDPPEDPDR